MKISEILANEKPTLSFEYFPARTENRAESLDKTIDILTELNPDFVSVTFGAGGSTKDGSYELVKKLKEQKKLEVIAYLAAYALKQDEVTDVLNCYRDLGIENMLALRGDPPKDGSLTQSPTDSFKHASDLVGFIHKNYSFCLGVAGHPEGHPDAINIEKDLEYLKYKVDLGAEFVIANFFHDNLYFFKFLERCAKSGIKVPILPGIMPLYSIRIMELLAANCGASIPDKLRKGIAQLPKNDPKAFFQYGIEFGIQQCEELLNEGACGLHLYVLNKYESTEGIVKGLRDKGFLTD